MRSVSIMSMLLAAAAVTAAEPAAPTYPVRLERPFREGQRLAIVLTIDSTLVRRVAVGDELVPRKVERQNRLECEVLVQRVQGEQWEQLQVRPTVATGDENGVKTALTNPGQPVTVARTAERVTFTGPDGKALPGVDTDLLNRFFSKSTKVTPDAAFGPERPVAVGDSWAVRPEAVRDMLAAAGLGAVKPESISGSFTLAAVAGTPPRLHIKGTVKCRDFAVPGVKPESAELVMNIAYDLAADPQAPDRVARLEIDWGYTASQTRADGVVIRESLRHHNVRQETLRPVAPAAPAEAPAR